MYFGAIEEVPRFFHAYSGGIIRGQGMPLRLRQVDFEKRLTPVLRTPPL
jgi:hypothetical protein